MILSFLILPRKKRHSAVGEAGSYRCMRLKAHTASFSDTELHGPSALALVELEHLQPWDTSLNCSLCAQYGCHILLPMVMSALARGCHASGDVTPGHDMWKRVPIVYSTEVADQRVGYVRWLNMSFLLRTRNRGDKIECPSEM